MMIKASLGEPIPVGRQEKGPERLKTEPNREGDIMPGGRRYAGHLNEGLAAWKGSPERNHLARYLAGEPDTSGSLSGRNMRAQSERPCCRAAEAHLSGSTPSWRGHLDD